MAQAKFVEGNLFRHVTVMSLTASVGLMAIFIVDLVNMVYISWLKDDDDEDAADLPEPAALAQSAMIEMEAALEELRAILAELGEEIAE